MKLVHWAILFVIIILPFSIISRTTIQKKTLVLQDQTRINNILDAATYDGAGAMLEELANTLGYGENVPITHSAAMAAIDRFFQTLAVNFNIPAKVEIAKDYFGQYIPVLIIVGYDGLYVYSYDLTDEGYMYVLKPKIPFSYRDSDSDAVINFTLGNDVKIYIPSKNLVLEGELKDDVLDSTEYLDMKVTVQAQSNPKDYIENSLPKITSNLSIILNLLMDDDFYGINPLKIIPEYMLNENVTQDYVYNDQNKVINEEIVDGKLIPKVSEFHKIRRDTIINLITSVLKEEVNEHDTYADLIGVNYDFNIPTIDKEQWQNTIDDISVLAFFQGMPIGIDSFYNNYSLGGAKIVKANNNLYAVEKNGQRLYHRYNCSELLGVNGVLDYDDYDMICIDVQEANSYKYYACKKCR